MAGDRSCTSPCAVPRCSFLGRGLRLVSAGPVAAVQGSACSGRQSSRRPAPLGHPQPSSGVNTGCCWRPPRRQGVHAHGADSRLLTVFPKYPNLYRCLKLPISFSALFKRRDVVLLENQRFAVNCLVIVSTTRVDLKKKEVADSFMWQKPKEVVGCLRGFSYATDCCTQRISMAIKI